MCTWSQPYVSSSVDQRVTEDGHCCCREAVFVGTGCAPTVCSILFLFVAVSATAGVGLKYDRNAWEAGLGSRG